MGGFPEADFWPGITFVLPVIHFRNPPQDMDSNSVIA